MIAGLAPRAAAALALFVIAMLVAPFVASSYAMSLLITVLFAAVFGQAWNFMTGMTGQLSLGHALYVGLGAYASAALYVKFGLTPWIGMLVGAGLAVAAGSVIAALSLRFGVSGVYFALLTIAFAEFTRILFDHFQWVGATAGLFLPLSNATRLDLVDLRGVPTLFYYCLLALMLATLLLGAVILRRRIGYYWQAIREDPAAAEALGINLFRGKLAAVALSAALTAIGGGLLAFYENNLYPNSEFAMQRSVELIVAPIVGGLGTLFGPILGAFVLTALSELTTWAGAALRIDGLKQLLYGALLLLIVAMQPAGLWPWIRDRLGFRGDGA